METKVSDSIVEKVARKVGFSFFVTVPPRGIKGGLAFLWRPELDFNVIWKSEHLIHLLIKSRGDVRDFFYTLAYRPIVWFKKEVF